MNKKHAVYCRPFFLCLAILLLAAASAAAAPFRYFNLVDDNGHTVYVTGWPVRSGDQCITAGNQRFEVIEVNGQTAKVRLIGAVDLSGYILSDPSLAKDFSSKTAYAAGKGKVAVYHTHSDESYVPTDGTESILGNGGIYKVGDAFSSALERNGLDVIHSANRHDPHDDMAYERSRRTVTDLLKQQPDAVFDVHRDSTPPEVYETSINGQNVTKVQLVVGKYGPTGKQIEDYALQLKALADKQHPGLVKGIFFAKGGDYNQDLFPRSMLVEVGAHTNDRQSAERGIALFADVIPALLGQTAASPANPSGAAGLGTTTAGFSGATKGAAWLIGLAILGTAAFLLLSTGSFREAKSKLRQFTSAEFTGFLGPRLRLKRRQNTTKNEKDKN